MFSAKYFAFLCGILTVIDCTFGEPDSAGIVPLPNGLAYGGIPYGSVSGMLADYPRQQLNEYNNNNYYYYPQPGQYKRSSNDQLQPQPGSQIIVTPNVLLELSVKLDTKYHLHL
ncbi:uncharacterized protein LOC122853136 isoform X2 [Aphidius gifuensis]|uniref:uncharacterized protein LOC122853136 isoform X2 n=1 Tax=Aphidius gifuensis TaxID=684658 RepID=UPI001CDCF02A|nr:uncharacterized protein LOC122853136 isoform X2 [Aphidius gifuensis]